MERKRTYRMETLSLQAKVAAIHLYDKDPEYMNVARHFPCTAYEIKSIIADREEILKKWDDQTIKLPDKKERPFNPQLCRVTQSVANTLREVNILNKAMDAWICDCMNDPQFVAPDDLIKAKVCEFKKLHCLRAVIPSKEWIEAFRKKYDLKAADPPSEPARQKTKRPRNRLPPKDVLSLHAKVAAIHLYDKDPVYRNVARHFPCTAYYIETIIEARDEILKEWSKQTVKMPINEIKTPREYVFTSGHYRVNVQREMEILNHEMDLWICKCRTNDPDFVAASGGIEAKALALKKLYNLKTVEVDERWIAGVRKKYNLREEEEPASGAPETNAPSSKADSAKTAGDQVQLIKGHDGMRQSSKAPEVRKCSLGEMMQHSMDDAVTRYTRMHKNKNQLLKIDFLNETIFEWILRMQSRGKGPKITTKLVIRTARIAKTHLNILNMCPKTLWLRKFMSKYSITEMDMRSDRLYERCTEPKEYLSLKIPDVVDYVTDFWERVNNIHQWPGTPSHRYQIAYTKSKNGSVVADVVLVDGVRTSPKNQVSTFDDFPVECEEVLDDDVLVKCEEVDDDDVSVKCEEIENDVDHQSRPSVPINGCYTRRKSMEVDEFDEFDEVVEIVEIVDDVDPVEGACTPLKVEEVIEDPVDGEVVHIKEESDEEEQVPRKRRRLESPYSRDSRRSRKKLIESDEEALRFVKALENFVLLESNFRAIGVISQLEAVFRKP